jgi:anti-anti-sigma factor
MLHFRAHTIADVVLVEFIVPGIHDGPEIEDLSEELHEMIGRSVSKKMIIDLASVRFMASRAISLLLSLKQLVDIHHGQLLICGLREQVVQIFRITGQDRFLSLLPTRDLALAALSVATPG